MGNFRQWLFCEEVEVQKHKIIGRIQEDPSQAHSFLERGERLWLSLQSDQQRQLHGLLAKFFKDKPEKLKKIEKIAEDLKALHEGWVSKLLHGASIVIELVILAVLIIAYLDIIELGITFTGGTFWGVLKMMWKSYDLVPLIAWASLTFTHIGWNIYSFFSNKKERINSYVDAIEKRGLPLHTNMS